jgi:hypothetical protein
VFRSNDDRIAGDPAPVLIDLEKTGFTPGMAGSAKWLNPQQ